MHAQKKVSQRQPFRESDCTRERGMFINQNVQGCVQMNVNEIYVLGILAFFKYLNILCKKALIVFWKKVNLFSTFSNYAEYLISMDTYLSLTFVAWHQLKLLFHACGFSGVNIRLCYSAVYMGQ